MALPKRKVKLDKGISMPPNVPDIFLAAERNDVRELELALEYYDVNERDEIDMTPLHHAASTLAEDTRDRLLQHPDVDATLADKFGRSAATVAFECWGLMSTDYLKKLNPFCYPWLYSKPDSTP